MIKIVLDNVNCKISGEIDTVILKKMDSEMSYEHPGYRFMSGSRGGYNLSGKYGGWDGRVRLLSKSMKFPIGLLALAREILDENNIEYEIVDTRPSIEYGSPIEIDESVFKIRGYQKDAAKCAKKNGSGIIRMATGGGKTLVISSIVAEYNIPTIIYVIGVELLYQMKKTMEDAYGVECGIVGGGECDASKKITIMTVWSAAAAFNKKAKVIENDATGETSKQTKNIDKALVRKKVEEAQLIIVDECQYAASETIQFLHRVSTRARHRFLLSGTPWRDTGDDILIEAVAGRKIYDLNATKLIKLKNLVPPDIHFLNVPVVRKPGNNYHEVYTNYIVENEDRNGLIIKAAKKLVAAGKKVLILVVRVQHGKLLMGKLEDEFSVKYLDGTKSAKKRMQAIQDMRDGSVDILIASKIFDQGIDIPELDALILAGSGKSSGRALQRIGRVIRTAPGKEKAIVVDFFDNCKYLRNHSEARISVYNSEPGFNIKVPKNKEIYKYPKREPVKWT